MSVPPTSYVRRMSSPRRPDRRAFLQGALCTIAGAALVGGCSRDTPYDDAALSQPALLPTLGAARVREIGQAYLRATPTESAAFFSPWRSIFASNGRRYSWRACGRSRSWPWWPGS